MSLTLAVAPVISLGTATSSTQPISILNGSGATSWVLQYAIASSGAWVTFSSPAVGAASVTVTGLSSSTSYDYRILAVNTSGSKASNVATGSTASSGGLTAAQDWTNRSTAGGVVQALRFPSATNVTAYTHADALAGNVVYDPNDGIIGDGCMKIKVQPTDMANSGAWRAPMNAAWNTDGQGFGSTDFYVQYRIKLGQNRLRRSVNGGGFKISIFGEYRFSSPNSSQSHTGNEVVINNDNWRGIPFGYREDSNGNPAGFEETVGSDIFLQPAVDHGSGAPNDRYCLYDSGDASPGCFFWITEEWLTVYIHFKGADYGGSSGTGNVFDMYIARDGDTTYTQLFNNVNFDIGSDALVPNGPNGLWLLPYDTNRTSASYGTYQKYDQIIVSTSPIACPQVESASAAPAWFKAVNDMFWAAPVSNWLGAAGVIDPLAATTNAGNSGHHAIIDAYTGMLRIGRKILAPANGGHNDYYGNEVYGLDFGDANPTWVRYRNATAASGAGSLTKWSDGNPVSSHTGTSLVSCAGHAFLAGMTATNYLGYTPCNQWFEYNLTTDAWIDMGSGYASNSAGAMGITSLSDEILEEVVAVHGGNGNPSIQFVTAATGAIAATCTNGLDINNNTIGDIDTSNRVVLMCDNSGGGNRYFWRKLSDRTGAWNGPLAATNNGVSYYAQSYAWHPASNGFLSYDRTSGALTKLTPTVDGSGNYTALVWTSHAKAGGTTPPAPFTSNGNSLYDKCGIVYGMGDGRDMFYAIPAYTNPDMRIMPLPIEGVY